MGDDSRIARILDPKLTLDQRLRAFTEFKPSGDTMPSDVLEKVLLIPDVELRESALELCDRQQEPVSAEPGLTLLRQGEGRIDMTEKGKKVL